MTQIGIGDPVEVKVRHREQGEIWWPATVVSVGHNSIGVAYSSGEREELPNNQQRWRSVR